jgi:glutamate dehydrogenase
MTRAATLFPTNPPGSRQSRLACFSQHGAVKEPPMRQAILVLAALSLVPAITSAEPLPGLLDAKTLADAAHEASQQKQDAQAAVTRQAKLLGYGKTEIAKALQPTMERKGSFKLSLNDGTVVEFPWFRTGFAENPLANTEKAIARDRAGQATRKETNKGGVRLHYGVFADEVYALALKMDTKLATARDALGSQSFRGAKGGIGAGRVVKVGTRYGCKVGDSVDPAAPIWNRAEMMTSFAAGYRATGGQVGPGFDIQAGDVNTKAPEMKILAETYGSPDRPSAGVSGKAVMRTGDGGIDPRGGIEYRGVSTGEGVWMTARLAAHRTGLKLRGATVVAQGWGEVGRAFGLAALRDGARVIAIQEIWNVGGKKVAGTLVFPGKNPKPAQIKAWLGEVETLRASGQDLKTYAGGRYASSFREGLDASQVKADIVGVNALGGVLSDKTVPRYLASGTHQGRRKIIVEGANLAETREGAKLLDRHSDKILTVPGDLANLDGVHVSDLEAVQNLFGQPVTSPRAQRSLLGTIRAGWNRAIKIAESRGISERQAIELSAVDGMMKRSLQVSGAPRASLEKRVLGREILAQQSSLLGSLGAKVVRPRLAPTPQLPARTPLRSALPARR